jgi:WD40 repeat protein
MMLRWYEFLQCQATLSKSGPSPGMCRFFDFAKSAARRAIRVIQDTHNVRSVAFHPCGDYLLAGFLDTFLYAHFSSSSYCATCLLLAVWSNKLTSSAETPVASKLYFDLCCFVFHNLDWCHSLVYITCVMLDFLCAGTDHPIPHLYDVSTFQCYLSSSLQDSHVGGSINQVFCPQMYWFLPSWKAC